MIDGEFLRKILAKSNAEHCESAEDMQHALEDIHDMVKERYPSVTENKDHMILHCPIDGAVVEYDDVLQLFKCTECDWAGWYHETKRPQNQ